MKKSEKILKKNNIPSDLSASEKTAIENNVLLRHIIDNDLKHLWWWIRTIAIAILSQSMAIIALLIKLFMGK